MNPKLNNLPTLISSSRIVLSLILYYVALYCCVGVGNFVGKHLSLSFYNTTINVWVAGVNWIWLSLVYGVFTFLIGITLVIVLFWQVFLKDFTKNPFAQLTLANFAQQLLSYSTIGFLAGFTLFSADSIISMIYVLNRLPK